MSTLKDKFFKRFIPYTFNQAGDTIVEVMIALAVLSLSLGISYEAANGGINQSVNAQEHAQALGLIDAQVEELRSAIDNNTAVIPNGSNDFFCMSNNGSLISFNVSPTVPVSASQDSKNGYSEYPTSCNLGTNNLFHVSISPNGSNYGYNTPATSPETSYTVTVRWDGVGSLGPQQESLTYRIGSSNNSNYAYPITIAVPPVPLPSITDLGSSYSYCAHGEHLFSDGADGCFKSGNFMYAYRQVFVQYPFSGGQTAAQTSITINYNQFGSIGQLATNNPSYNFELYACAVPPNSPPIPSNQPEPTSISYFDTFPPTTGPNASTGPCASSSPTDITLPIESSPTTSSSFSISNYVSGDSIELDWVNNVTSSIGDPNLEINSVTLNQQ